MITLTQVPNAIRFGSKERYHVLSTERFSHFIAEDVFTAANDLASRYPDETGTIDRYAARLLEMVE